MLFQKTEIIHILMMWNIFSSISSFENKSFTYDFMLYSEFKLFIKCMKFKDF